MFSKSLVIVIAVGLLIDGSAATATTSSLRNGGGRQLGLVSDSSSADTTATAVSSSADQDLPVVINAPQGDEDQDSYDATEDVPVVIIAPDKSASASASASESEDDGPGFGCQSVQSIVCGQDILSSLCSLLSSDLEESLKGGEWTFFAPTDEAIKDVQSVLDSLSTSELERIWEFQAHKGDVFFPSDLVCTEKMMMESGDMSRTKCVKNDDNVVEKYQNGNGNTKLNMMPKILLPSLRACNGIIHIMDAVMFPVHGSISEAAEDEIVHDGSGSHDASKSSSGSSSADVDVDVDDDDDMMMATNETDVSSSDMMMATNETDGSSSSDMIDESSDMAMESNETVSDTAMESNDIVSDTADP